MLQQLHVYIKFKFPNLGNLANLVVYSHQILDKDGLWMKIMSQKKKIARDSPTFSISRKFS
jgi:hypothetical protein